MRVLHITTVRELYSGQRRQLESEVEAARAADLPWETLALHVGEPLNSFEKRIPRLFQSRLMIRAYGWITAIRRSGDYDLILLRDMQLDLFGPLMGLFVRNRFTVHHAKEMEELAVLRGGGFYSRIAVLLERYVKPLTMRSAKGVAAVTGEIRDYELDRFPWLRERSLVLPNGYAFRSSTVAGDARNAGKHTFTFVCAEFTAWHGLDRLIDALQSVHGRTHSAMTIHLVGKLNEEQREMVEGVRSAMVEVHCHGTLPKDAINLLLAETDVAIGSLALDRQSLREAATLKVREYLAAGVPVYATHRDAALPEDFPYFYNDSSGVSIPQLLAMARDVSGVSRAQVREESRIYLDKEEIMRAGLLRLEALNGPTE